MNNYQTDNNNMGTNDSSKSNKLPIQSRYMQICKRNIYFGYKYFHNQNVYGIVSNHLS